MNGEFISNFYLLLSALTLLDGEGLLLLGEMEEVERKRRERERGEKRERGGRKKKRKTRASLSLGLLRL